MAGCQVQLARCCCERAEIANFMDSPDMRDIIGMKVDVAVYPDLTDTGRQLMCK